MFLFYHRDLPDNAVKRQPGGLHFVWAGVLVQVLEVFDDFAPFIDDGAVVDFGLAAARRSVYDRRYLLPLRF